jgi:hypothetical protein
MSRVDNWPLVMNELVEQWRARPLSFGDGDCFQFLGAHVLAITGVEYRDQFPQYASREEAAEILEQHGGAVGLLTGIFGEPKPVAFAQRGDAVVCDFGDGLAAAVCVGFHCCAPGPRGLRFEPTLNAVAAWSV